MSVEVTNETVWQIDGKVFSDLGIWVMDQMRVSTQSDLTIMFVDPDPIAQLHMRWMNLEGPTDVMSFPMDELRPGDGRTVMEGVLGDIVICPWVAAQQALAAGHNTMEEMMLLTIHASSTYSDTTMPPQNRSVRCSVCSDSCYSPSSRFARERGRRPSFRRIRRTRSPNGIGSMAWDADRQIMIDVAVAYRPA